VRRVVRRSDLRGIIARLVRRHYDGGRLGRRVGLRGDTTRAPSQGPRPKGGRHDAALSFPFGIGTKAANQCHLVKCSVYLISRPRFLHFTLNHYRDIYDVVRPLAWTVAMWDQPPLIWSILPWAPPISPRPRGGFRPGAVVQPPADSGPGPIPPPAAPLPHDAPNEEVEPPRRRGSAKADLM
jgi:hypothetical protein